MPTLGKLGELLKAVDTDIVINDSHALTSIQRTHKKRAPLI